MLAGLASAMHAPVGFVQLSARKRMDDVGVSLQQCSQARQAHASNSISLVETVWELQPRAGTICLQLQQ